MWCVAHSLLDVALRRDLHHGSDGGRMPLSPAADQAGKFFFITGHDDVGAVRESGPEFCRYLQTHDCTF